MIHDRLDHMRQYLSWLLPRSWVTPVFYARVRRLHPVPILGLTLMLGLTGCDTGLFRTHAPPPVVPATTGKVADDYIIGSGDPLSIFVYRNPDLSEPSVAVRPDGRISTPLIEDIVAAGKTPTQLAREIEQRLTKYIQEPNVTVIVRGFIGPPDRQVRVIGEATDPIAIPYRDHMTLLDVMIATKGLTRYAAGNRAISCASMPTASADHQGAAERSDQ